MVNAAGAANGAYLTCPCVPQEGFTAFTQAYQQAYGVAPQTYSAEAYDSATSSALPDGFCDTATRQGTPPPR